jgi:HEAT repeat protein
MKRGRRVSVGLGVLAAGLLGALFFRGPLKEGILERWCLHQLDSDDPGTRRGAAETLGDLRSQAAIPILVGIALEEKGNLPAWVPQTLVRIGPEGARTLFGELRVGGKWVDSGIPYAVAALGKDARPAVPFVVELLDNPEEFYDTVKVLREQGEEAVPGIVRALKSETGAFRQRAAWALGEIGSPARVAVPALEEALQDRLIGVRSSAIAALSNLAPASEAVPVLTEMLEDCSHEVQEAAAVALSHFGPAASGAIPALLPRLFDHDHRVVLQMVEVLSKIDQEGRVLLHELEKGLEGESPLRRTWAAEALGSLPEHAKVVVPAIGKALAHEDEELRIECIQALALMKTDEAFQHIALTLKDRDFKVQLKAAEVLAREMKFPEEAVPVLIDGLKRDGAEAKVAWPCIRQYGLYAKAAIPLLVEMLKDSREELKARALELLAEFMADDVREHIPAMTALLKDESKHVRILTMYLLKTVGEVPDSFLPEFLEACVDAFHDLDPNFRDRAVSHLASLGERASPAVPELIPLLGTEVAYMAQTVLLAIGPPAVPALEKALLHPEPKIRARAAAALGEIGAKPFLKPLAPLLKDPDPQVRLQAAAAMDQISGDPRALLPILIEGLSSKEEMVRCMALRFLWQMGPRAAPAIPAILKRLDDEEPGMIAGAVNTLGRIGPAAGSAVRELKNRLRFAPADLASDIKSALSDIESPRP